MEASAGQTLRASDEQQRPGVLGGGHGVAFGGVQHHHALLRVAAGTSTLSTPTPARPITFSRFGVGEDFGGDFRLAADDQRVVIRDGDGQFFGGE